MIKLKYQRIFTMFKSVFPKFNKESFGQRLEKVPKEFHKYMVEQQRLRIASSVSRSNSQTQKAFT